MAASAASKATAVVKKWKKRMDFPMVALLVGWMASIIYAGTRKGLPVSALDRPYDATRKDLLHQPRIRRYPPPT